MPNQDDVRYLDEAVAAELLGVEESKLRRWRMLSQSLDDSDLSPPHNLDDAGNIRYRRRGLIEWREMFVFPPAEVSGDGVW